MRAKLGLLGVIFLVAGCAAQSGSVGGGSVVGNCMNPAGCEMKAEKESEGECGCGSQCGCEMPAKKGKASSSGCGCGAK